MTHPPDDRSVFREPHLRGGPYRSDPSEASADETLREATPSDSERVEQTVWDEPGISDTLTGGRPSDALTYARWLDKGRSETSLPKSWLITMGLALVAGPWAIVGALFGGGGGTVSHIIAIIVVAPVIEETMKIAAVLYVVERRPFLLRSAAQIGICTLVSGLTFACIENLLYLRAFLNDPSPALTYWRWTVCVGLHVGCSSIAGFGLMRIWRDIWNRRARPRLQLGFPYVVTAVVIHGVYNAFAVALHLSQFRF